MDTRILPQYAEFLQVSAKLGLRKNVAYSRPINNCRVREMPPAFPPDWQTGLFASIFLRTRFMRRADNEPLIFEKTYIPYYLCGGIEALDFSGLSLYQTLSNRYSLNLFHAVETIEAVVISGDNEKKLKCRGRMPGYKIS
jgi:DNA-binding GntR family transcriptional regulator